MGFKKGKPKTGGRKKGTPNKVSSDIVETLETLGHNPAAVQVEIFNESWNAYKEKKEAMEKAPNPEEKQRAGWGMSTLLLTAERANTELMKYVYPTKKSIDANMKGQVSFTAWVGEMSGSDEAGDE
jgi:hypothetical protein